MRIDALKTREDASRSRKTSALAAMVAAVCSALVACSSATTAATPDTTPAADAPSGAVLPTEGSLNTRAVAGYTTDSGMRLADGRLYRSSALNYLTDSDQQLLASHDIQTVIDFRSPEEARKAPDKLPPGARYINAPIIPDKLDSAEIGKLLDAEHFSAQMHDATKVTPHGPFYRMLTLVNSYGKESFVKGLSAYKPVFDVLSDPAGDGAVLMHCTGGRDRTGIATALVLRTIGVPLDQIERDYLASNELLQPERGNPNSTEFEKFEFSSVFIQPPGNRSFQEVAAQLDESPEHIYDAVKLKPEYLTTLFAAIDKYYGSFPEFLNQAMGVSPEKVAAIKTRLTQTT